MNNTKNSKGNKLIFCLICLLGTFFLMGCESNDKEITLSIAASLVEPMKEIKSQYEKISNCKINFNVGGSGTLKKQITQGADVDMFFSANEKYSMELISEGLALESDKYDILKNSLVLIKNKNCNVDIKKLSEIKNIEGKIAIGEISTVPAGQYTKETLENTGVWPSIENNTIYGKNVNTVKNYVETGNVDLGFVYRSDSIDLKNSKVLLEVPDDTHTPIIYSLSIIKDTKNKLECENILNFIKSDKGKEIFRKYGFL